MKNDHHHIPRFQLTPQLQEPSHGRPRRISGKDPFFAGNPSGHQGRVPVGNLLKKVNQ